MAAREATVMRSHGKIIRGSSEEEKSWVSYTNLGKNPNTFVKSDALKRFKIVC